jgi:hypothetical protein
MADENEIVQKISLEGGEEVASTFIKIGESATAGIGKVDKALTSGASALDHFGESGKAIGDQLRAIAVLGGEVQTGIGQAQTAFAELGQGLKGLHGALGDMRKEASSAISTLRNLAAVEGVGAKIGAISTAVTGLGRAFNALLGPVGLVISAIGIISDIAGRVQGSVDKAFALKPDLSAFEKLKADLTILHDKMTGVPAEETAAKLKAMGAVGEKAGDEIASGMDKAASAVDKLGASADKTKQQLSPAAEYNLQHEAYEKFPGDPAAREKYIGEHGGTPMQVQDETGKPLAPVPPAAEKTADALTVVTNAAREVAAALWDLGGLLGGKRDPALEKKPMQFGGHVPGSGDTDSVAAVLTPGEFVIRKDGGNIAEALAHFGFGHQGGGPVTYPAGRDVTPPSYPTGAGPEWSEEAFARRRRAEEEEERRRAAEDARRNRERVLAAEADDRPYTHEAGVTRNKQEAEAERYGAQKKADALKFVQCALSTYKTREQQYRALYIANSVEAGNCKAKTQTDGDWRGWGIQVPFQMGGPVLPGLFAGLASLPGGVVKIHESGGHDPSSWIWSGLAASIRTAGKGVRPEDNILRPFGEGTGDILRDVRLLPPGFAHGGAVDNFVQRFMRGGLVSGFASGVHGYAGGGAVTTSTTPATASYHQLDLRTDKGSFRASVSHGTMEALAGSALASKLSRTGERPGWWS